MSDVKSVHNTGISSDSNKALKLVYLASPYSHKDPKVIHKRFEDAMRACLWGWTKGYLVYSPIFYTHLLDVALDCTVPHTYWVEFGLRMIDNCDQLWALKLRGWTKSVGVKYEINYAKSIGKEIVYIDPKEIVFDENNGYGLSWEQLVYKVYRFASK